MILVFRLLSYLPLVWLHRLGAVAGWASWLFSPTYRRNLRSNMVLALGEDGYRRARGAAIASAGKTSCELPSIWLRPLEETAARVVGVTGWEWVEAAQRAGKGIVFVSGHLGCFEISAQYLATRMPLTVLYRAPKQAWLQAMIEAGRARGERLRIAAADLAGVRTLVKALKRGESIALLSDQVPKKGEGYWLDFFGKPAFTMTLAARFSELDVAVIMFRVERLPGGAGYHFHLQPPMQPIAGSTEERAGQINREIERLIRQCPGQYLWGYNRYKRPRDVAAPPERH